MKPSFTCPTCHTSVTSLATASSDSVPEAGSLYICGACASLSEFTPRGLHLLTIKQLRRLSAEEMRDIRFAVRNIIAHAKHSMDSKQSRILGLNGKPIQLN